MEQASGGDRILHALERAPELMAAFSTKLQLRDERDGLHALIVEDQRFSRQLMQQMLHDFCTVDAAEGVKDGLRHYLQEAPNIAFLDIELAEDNGHMLAQIIKSIDPDAFVVMVTGNHTAADVAQAQANHIDGFIVKPFSKQKIMTCLAQYGARHPNFQTKGPPS